MANMEGFDAEILNAEDSIAELMAAVEAGGEAMSREDFLASLEGQSGDEARAVYSRLQEVTLPLEPDDYDMDGSIDSSVG